MQLVVKRVSIVTALTAAYSIGAWGQAVVGDVNRDGVIDQTDVNLIAAAVRTKAIGEQDPRDVNGDGRITSLDVLLAALRCTQTGCAVVPAVRLTQSAPSVTMVQRQGGYLTTYLHYASPDKTPRTVTVSQTLTPVGSAAAAGVAITPSIATKLTVSGPTTIPMGQAMTGVAPGTYRLTTSAQLGSAAPQTSTATITVSASPSDRALLPLAVSPGAVPVHTGADVVLSTRAVNFNPDNPPSIRLVGLDFSLNVPMTDDGTGADSTAGDGIYAAAVSLTADPGSCLTVGATDGTVESAPTKICATTLPCFPAASATDGFTDADGSTILKDVILISFAAGVSEDDMYALAGSLSAEIIGGLPELHAYQFKLKSIPRSLAGLQSIVAAVQTFPIVASAETSQLAKPAAAYVPTNSGYEAAQQNWVSRIRLDEAWYWARGGCTKFPSDFVYMKNCNTINVGILDGGVTSPWISLLPGHNMVDGSTNTPDFADPIKPGNYFYHGTFVAGIAGAFMNTGPGVTGVAPGAQFTPVKIFFALSDPLRSNADYSPAGIASAINWAAAHGIQVINASLTTAYNSAVCTAVANAALGGHFVVAAAGNDGGQHALSYSPVACAAAIGVGGADLKAEIAASYTNVDAAVTVLTPSPVYSTVPADPSGFGGKAEATSFATPVVSGTLALMKSLTRSGGSSPYNNFTAAQFKDRLIKTSVPLTTPCPKYACSGGRLDVAEAVFNLSFEDSNLTPWLTTGTAAAIASVQGTCPGGPLCPQDRKQMGRFSIGAAGDGTSASFVQELYPFLDVTTPPTVTLKYAFVTTRPPAARPSPVNESFTASVTQQLPRQPVVTFPLGSEAVNTSTLTPLSGVTLAGGNGTVYWSGWKTVSAPIDLIPGNWVKLNLALNASGATGGYQTIVLVDGVKFQ